MNKMHQLHHIEYMPTGELFAEQRDHWATPYRFNGKELDEETGYYYYGARYYTPELGIWLSVDPLSDKYPSLSPFMYCAGNPVIYIDPDGRDIWEINENGKILNHYKNDKKDVFNVMDDAGKVKASKELPVGTVSKSYSYTCIDRKVKDKKDKTVKRDIPIDVYIINNTSESQELFKFMADNTNVEWGNTQSEAKGIGVLTTSHSPDYELGSVDVANYLHSKGVKMSGHDHNHPDGKNRPSEGDRNFARKNQKRNPHFETRIYTRQSGNFHHYDKDGYIGVMSGN